MKYCTNYPNVNLLPVLALILYYVRYSIPIPNTSDTLVSTPEDRSAQRYCKIVTIRFQDVQLDELMP